MAISKKLLLGGLLATTATAAACTYNRIRYRKVKDLKGKTALITGAAGGLGRAICLELAKRKEITTYILWDLQFDEIKITAEKIRQVDPNATVHLEKVNVAERDHVYKAAEKACNLLGGVSPYLIVNNAGIIAGNKGCLETDDARIELETKVNALAHVWVCKAFIPKMVEKKTGGHFLNVASMAAQIAAGDMTTYAMSKKAAKGFSEGLNAELKIRGYDKLIKISVFCPAHILTELFEGFDSGGLSMTAEYAAERAVKAVEGEVELTLVPDALSNVTLFIGLNEWFGKLNLSNITAEYSPMSGWKGEKADKIFQQMDLKVPKSPR